MTSAYLPTQNIILKQTNCAVTSFVARNATANISIHKVNAFPAIFAKLISAVVNIFKETM